MLECHSVRYGNRSEVHFGFVPVNGNTIGCRVAFLDSFTVLQATYLSMKDFPSALQSTSPEHAFHTSGRHQHPNHLDQTGWLWLWRWEATPDTKGKAQAAVMVCTCTDWLWSDWDRQSGVPSAEPCHTSRLRMWPPATITHQYEYQLDWQESKTWIRGSGMLFLQNLSRLLQLFLKNSTWSTFFP